MGRCQAYRFVGPAESLVGVAEGPQGVGQASEALDLVGKGVTADGLRPKNVVNVTGRCSDLTCLMESDESE